MIWTGYIACCIYAASVAAPSGVPSRGNSEQPARLLDNWATTVLRDVDELEKAVVRLRAIERAGAEMRRAGNGGIQDGVQAGVRPGALRRWWHDEQELNARRRVWEGVVDLWYATGKASIIVKVADGDLAGKAEEVLQEFRRWIEQHKDEPLGRVLTENIPENLEALRTKYIDIALKVLAQWVAFDMWGLAPDRYPYGISWYTPHEQEELYQWYSTWYRVYRGTWRWDPSSQKITSENGLPFRRGTVNEAVKRDRVERERK